jgi:hypothetical protein
MTNGAVFLPAPRLAWLKYGWSFSVIVANERVDMSPGLHIVEGYLTLLNE